MLLRNLIEKAHPLSNPLELWYFRNSRIIFLSLCCYWDEKSPGQKGSSSLQENLDNFLEQMDNPLWYVSTPFVVSCI